MKKKQSISRQNCPQSKSCVRIRQFAIFVYWVMIVFFWNNTENTSITDVVQYYWNTFILYTTDTFDLLCLSHGKAFAEFVEKFPESIYFDDFQWKLIRIFAALLFLNLFLIFLVWKVFGKSICERFMKLCKYDCCEIWHNMYNVISTCVFLTATQREIEELKASVSKLKLPKEHTPRI